jgi:serine/threonine protein kinase
VLLCKQEFECPAVKTEKNLSRHFYRFVRECLHSNPDDRPSVKELLEHSFLKNSKGAAYIQSIIKKQEKNLSASESSLVDSSETTSSVKPSSSSVHFSEHNSRVRVDFSPT